MRRTIFYSGLYDMTQFIWRFETQNLVRSKLFWSFQENDIGAGMNRPGDGTAREVSISRFGAGHGAAHLSSGDSGSGALPWQNPELQEFERSYEPAVRTYRRFTRKATSTACSGEVTVVSPPACEREVELIVAPVAVLIQSAL